MTGFKTAAAPSAVRARRQAMIILAVLVSFAGIGRDARADAPALVKHPNLLLNREEIAQVRAKIQQHDWAKRLLNRVKELADDKGRVGRTPREAALVYVLTGDKTSGEAVHRALISGARHELAQLEKNDLQFNPDYGAWGPWATWAWAYDLTYELYTQEERALIEKFFRSIARTIIAGLKLRSTTPNLVFEKHWKVGLIGYCLGDKELIEWGLNDPGHHGRTHGGFYPVLDTMIKDRYFWGEAPIYALHYDVHGMLALAEAALHYDGTDLYHYTSKQSGASIKNLLDGYLRLAFPLEKTGIGAGSIRMATFGDGSTSYSPSGALHDTFLVNPPSTALGEPTLSGELEIAWKRYQDPGYAWLVSLNRQRDQYIGSAGQGHNRPIWGFAALTHGAALPDKLAPPPAPGGIYPSQGFAMLRSEESPRYWTSGGMAAVLRLGALTGHGHKDYYHLILHGKGRLLYPDLNIIQYEPTYLNWTHEGIAHNTLLVDQHSPRPGPFTTRHEFTPEAKFFAIHGSAFPDIVQTRALMMTPEYLTDVFQASDHRGGEHTFDWVLHGLGRLYPGNPAAYRPTEALLPHYWWVDNECSRSTDDAWQADWIQNSAGVTAGLQPFGKEWFAHSAGVRLTMLGAKDTQVCHGDTPITDGPPYHRLDGNLEGSAPMILARRRGSAVTFSAVHEPYEKRPALRAIRRIQESESAVGLAVEGADFSDRVLITFQAGKEQTLRAKDGEAFTFSDHGYLRRKGATVLVRGRVNGFRLRAAQATKVLLNGKEEPALRDGDFLVYGEIPAQAGDASAPATVENSAEQRAAAHYFFQPEEAHLKAGGAKEVALNIRCVGAGELRGRLRLMAPKGITVEPAAIEVAGLSEGQEKTVRLRIQAAADSVNALHAIRVEPADGAIAATGTLPVSVGVVLTEDKRIPLAAQFIVRAPGYTMKVDQYSGLSYYLLDADGHRRHGRLHNTNFCNGIGAVEREGHWLFRYGTPCRFVWEGKNSLTIGSASTFSDARLRYTFSEDQIALELVPPTKPTAEQTLWLGNFDALGPPHHNGMRKRPNDPIAADWFFFPHPVHRQGLLLILPEKRPVPGGGTAIRFPIRSGQRILLRFATAEDLASLVKEE